MTRLGATFSPATCLPAASFFGLAGASAAGSFPARASAGRCLPRETSSARPATARTGARRFHMTLTFHLERIGTSERGRHLFSDECQGGEVVDRRKMCRTILLRILLPIGTESTPGVRILLPIGTEST